MLGRGLRACASVLPASDSCLGRASGRAGQGARSARVAAPEAPLTRLSGSRLWAAGAGSPRFRWIGGAGGGGAAVRLGGVGGGRGRGPGGTRAAMAAWVPRAGGRAEAGGGA